ncbi:hypothetical protein CEB3_c46830 [Peptococcaceae bacterium CEB3]|nr:hypothetical protein CEB3_c46830 [Peptococcaceae bacterium CEB3]
MESGIQMNRATETQLKCDKRPMSGPVGERQQRGNVRCEVSVKPSEPIREVMVMNHSEPSVSRGAIKMA